MKTVKLSDVVSKTGDNIQDIIDQNPHFNLTPDTKVIVIEFAEGDDPENNLATFKIVTANTLSEIWVA